MSEEEINMEFSQDPGVHIDVSGCHDVFDVINATIDGEIEYHKKLGLIDGVSEDYAEGFIVGMRTVKDIVLKTRDVAAMGFFDDLGKG